MNSFATMNSMKITRMTVSIIDIFPFQNHFRCIGKIRMARRYYDKLYKEYAIVDLSRYESRNIGMRWRTEKEVVEGKGQFICGARSCGNIDELASYEIPFQYHEHDEDKLELVKVRLCLNCARKLYYSKKNEAKIDKKMKKKKRKHHESVEDVLIDDAGEGLESHEVIKKRFQAVDSIVESRVDISSNKDEKIEEFQSLLL